MALCELAFVYLWMMINYDVVAVLNLEMLLKISISDHRRRGRLEMRKISPPKFLFCQLDDN